MGCDFSKLYGNHFNIFLYHIAAEKGSGIVEKGVMFLTAGLVYDVGRFPIVRSAHQTIC